MIIFLCDIFASKVSKWFLASTEWYHLLKNSKQIFFALICSFLAEAVVQDKIRYESPCACRQLQNSAKRGLQQGCAVAFLEGLQCYLVPEWWLWWRRVCLCKEQNRHTGVCISVLPCLSQCLVFDLTAIGTLYYWFVQFSAHNNSMMNASSQFRSDHTTGEICMYCKLSSEMLR